MTHLKIYEMNYSAHPNGEDAFDVYAETDGILGRVVQSFDTLNDAVQFCYNSGTIFTIHTLEAWEKENASE